MPAQVMVATRPLNIQRTVAIRPPDAQVTAAIHTPLMISTSLNVKSTLGLDIANRTVNQNTCLAI